MKKTILADKIEAQQEVPNEDLLTPNKLAAPKEKSLQLDSGAENAGLDVILSIVKWVFLYLPGIFSIQLATMGLALMFLYRVFEPFGLIGFLVLGTFLIMLSFGKMRNLKYLKTVLTILAFSLLGAILYDLLAVLVKGDFFRLYLAVTYPLLAIIGFLSKRSVDAEEKQVRP